jgi:hypothetical protein
MHRSILTPLVMVAAAIFFLFGSAAAQESTTRGFTLGLHISGQSLTGQNNETNNAGGGGILIGYGLNRNVTIFAQFDGAQFDVENTDLDGQWTMGHGDLGARFHFANSLRSWVPYLQAAVSGRVVSLEDAVVNQQPATNVSFNGGALSLGGGFMFYFSQTLALDLQLMWSGGEFTTVTVGNASLSGFDYDATSTRFNVGLAWWP